MKIVIITGIIAIALTAVVLAIRFFMQGPDLSSYEVLKEPQLSRYPDRRVLEVAVKGIPDKVLPGAFKLLMQTYYKLKGVPRGPGETAPALRCPIPDEGYGGEAAFGHTRDWEGKIAIQVPESVQELPVVSAPPGMEVGLANWEYGEVAEILHIGPYADEPPTIKKLEEFIRNRGYKIIGEHEEEYLRGPGMFFSNPENYYTIIRYRITKTD